MNAKEAKRIVDNCLKGDVLKRKEAVKVLSENETAEEDIVEDQDDDTEEVEENQKN